MCVYVYVCVFSFRAYSEALIVKYPYHHFTPTNLPPLHIIPYQTALNCTTLYHVIRSHIILHRNVSGYDYDDMDAVCGLAKGNTGWGATHCFLPPAVRYRTSLDLGSRFHVVPRHFMIYHVIVRVQMLKALLSLPLPVFFSPISSLSLSPSIFPDSYLPSSPLSLPS